MYDKDLVESPDRNEYSMVLYRKGNTCVKKIERLTGEDKTAIVKRIKKENIIPATLFSPARRDPEGVREEQIWKTLTALHCPNILPLYSSSYDESTAETIQETQYCDCNLQEYLDQLTIPCDLSLAKQILADIRKGLHAMHSLGIVHGDLKTENILIEDMTDTATLHCMICDFGNSRYHTNGLVDRILGTPKCLPPETEFYIDKTTSPIHFFDMQSDIFTFGALAFTVLTQEDYFKTSHPYNSDLTSHTSITNGDPNCETPTQKKCFFNLTGKERAQKRYDEVYEILKAKDVPHDLAMFIKSCLHPESCYRVGVKKFYSHNVLPNPLSFTYVATKTN